MITLGLWAIGVPSPSVWGGLAGVLRFVPYIGALLAALAPIALAAAIDPGWSMVILVTGLFVIVEPVVAYVVEPLVYGHSTGLSPVAVIVAAVFWTWMWGPIGLILSTPITLCLVVMGRHVKSLEFVDILLGDRPALTPVETLLSASAVRQSGGRAGDGRGSARGPAPARLLRTVVLDALRRAADDVARGALSRERASAMTKSMLAIIDDLGEHEDPGTGRPRRGPAVTAFGGSRGVHRGPRPARRGGVGDAGAAAPAARGGRRRASPMPRSGVSASPSSTRRMSPWWRCRRSRWRARRRTSAISCGGCVVAFRRRRSSRASGGRATRC